MLTAAMDTDAIVGGDSIMTAAAAAVAGGLGRTSRGRQVSEALSKLFISAGTDYVPSWLVKRHPGLVERQRRWWLDRASLLVLSIAEGGALVSRGADSKVAVKRELAEAWKKEGKEKKKNGTGGEGRGSRGDKAKETSKSTKGKGKGKAKGQKKSR